MTREQIIRKLREIFSKHLGIDMSNVELDAPLQSLDIDSLDMMNLAVAIEKEFDVQISTADLMEIKSMEDVVTGLESKFQLSSERNQEAN